MSRITILILLLFVGCGESQPPELQNAVVTVTGKPNTEFYLSVNHIIRKVDGRNSSTEGSSDYGKRILDDTGNEQLTFENDHGLDVVLVALTDDLVKLSVKADNAAEQTAEVSKQLTFAHIKIGYEPEKDSVFARDPNDSVYEARKLVNLETGTE